MAPNHCVNYKCPWDPNAKRIQARELVCMYFNVPFKSYQQVCRLCLKKCILNFKLMGKQMENKKFLIDNERPTYHNFIELSESDEEDNVPSTSYEHPQEKKCNNALETIFQKFKLKNLMKAQKKKCQNYFDAEKSSLINETKETNNLIKENDNSLSNIFRKLYKYDNLRKFQFDKEVNIVDIDEVTNIDIDEVKIADVDEVNIVDIDEDNIANIDEGVNIVDIDEDNIANIDEGVNIVNNNDEVHTKDKNDASSKYLQEEIQKRCLLKSGDKVYAQKSSLLHPWYEATVQSRVNDMFFHTSFYDNSELIMNYKCLAYIHTIKEQYQIGTRIIAKFKDVDVTMTNNFYAGIIAELPTNFNNYRYLIFFDNGYSQYAYHEDIRLVCHHSPEVSDDLHINVKEFIKDYLDKYPHIPKVHFNINQFVRTKLDKKWYLANVINLDASLVQLKFHVFENVYTEWIFRGSNRLSPIFDHINKNQEKRVSYKTIANVNKTLNRPYIEFGYSTKNQTSNYENKSNSQEHFSMIDFINIPLSSPKPFLYKDHQCNHFCMLWVHYNVSQTKNLNTLSIPLHFGFQRHTIKNESQEFKTIKYITPCGRVISNENEMYNYLKIVANGENQMTINLFNFDHNVDPLAVFKITKYFKNIHDVSNGKEFKPISAVNCYNNSIPPPIRYITEREPKLGVTLNLDVKFLCGCDCTDNCEDKSKCSCWQLTLESVKNYPRIYKNHNIGYDYKRLYEPVFTGIYECNNNCRCLKTCSNRVVQEPLSTSLQIFFTEKKGWGVRTLADIPKGTFVCNFLAELYTEKDAEKKGREFGDNYLADLDYIEIAEAIKNGYESDVEYTCESDISDYEDEEFIPSESVKKKIKLSESSMSLRQKNFQTTNKKTDGKNEVSKLNTRQSVKTTNKTIRDYLNKDSSVYILDARTSGNVGRYLNHSCDPNIFVQNVFVDTHDLKFPWVAFFSSSNISAGTELCWDYAYEVGSVKGTKLLCYCDSKNCRGRLL